MFAELLGSAKESGLAFDLCQIWQIPRDFKPSTPSNLQLPLASTDHRGYGTQPPVFVFRIILILGKWDSDIKEEDTSPQLPVWDLSRKAEEAERRCKEEEDKRRKQEAAKAEKRKQVGAASAGGNVARSTRLSGKDKGKAMESTGKAPEGMEGGAETEESVRLAVKCRECTAKHRDCKAIFKGGKLMACEPCRKSKAKCLLLPDAERKRERAGTVPSPRRGEKQNKSKIAAAIAEGESAWDSDGEHRDNRDALGVLSQSMMGLTDEVRDFRMDFRRSMRLFDWMAFTLGTLAQDRVSVLCAAPLSKFSSVFRSKVGRDRRGTEIKGVRGSLKERLREEIWRGDQRRNAEEVIKMIFELKYIDTSEQYL
ncbi:hypothetical protein BV22DRAFT_1051642 [Leucogyrophana mollusca]|uniref:Uncharacterized protein n=1 Tax=Leucogyrophana mollusca TaxID=85980 RepID=A0ACB8AYT8_9AGAM|nr:hypothetical protein BV22DRAFT_1051642 [Leucogyrophana mollusca]